MLRTVLGHCYGSQVASLYTWHSYRSGLATALHAAGVDDAMIMLICRWMSPESLHVYRRMGTAENERHTRKAMQTNVDLIQATNVPKVMGDQGYAELFQTFKSIPVPEEWTQTAVSHAPEATPAMPTRLPAVQPTVPRSGTAASSTPPPPQDKRKRQTRARKRNDVPAAAPPKRRKRARRRHQQKAPTVDAGSTTGVGALDHVFPESLENYEVYNQRPPKRRAPTPRSRGRRPRRARGHGVRRDSG